MFRKYFIAIVLEGEPCEKAEQIKQILQEEYGLKGALRSPAHLTLHRPFEWKEEKESELIKTLEQFSGGKKFTLEFCGFSFFEPRVIYIDVKHSEELFCLQKSLTVYCQKNLRLLNGVNDERGFHPHVTVAFRDLRKPLFYQLQEKFKTEKFTGEMRVSRFSLLKLEKRWEPIKNFNI